MRRTKPFKPKGWLVERVPGPFCFLSVFLQFDGWLLVLHRRPFRESMGGRPFQKFLACRTAHYLVEPYTMRILPQLLQFDGWLLVLHRRPFRESMDGRPFQKFLAYQMVHYLAGPYTMRIRKVFHFR